MAICCVGLAVVFTVYSFRLVEVQMARHDEYAAIAAAKNSFRQVLHARRGLIRDRNGEPLAANMPIRTVVADGSHIKDPAALAKIAAPFLEMPEEELAAKLRTNRRYVVIKKGVPEASALALSKAMQENRQRGLYFEHDARRVYPNGPLLSHVIGFLDHEGKGVQGIERTMQEYLEGHDGFRHIERDRTGREMVVYRGQEEPSRNGHDVFLTVDMGLQALLEEELDAAFDELKPKSITAVIVRPKTGEILAMATRPSFDINAVGKAEPEQMKNRAIIDMIEPGSTFKIVAASAALNEGLVKPDTPIFCENGRFLYGGRTLRDHHRYGNLTVHDILVKSSNIGSAKLAMLMGGEKYYEYVRRFGFGERSGIELPGEIPGLVHPPHRWDKLTITRMPMGHSVAVTPLQITMAMAAIANDGRLMRPRIVREIRSETGEVIKTYEPEVIRQVVSPEAARMVRDALTEVVSPRGTAILASVQGFSVAGKTGTAQRVDPRGGYTPGKYVVSFVGFLPAEEPEIAASIIVDDASVAPGANYGGTVAAPIFSRVAEKAARHLDLVPVFKAEPAQMVQWKKSGSDRSTN